MNARKWCVWLPAERRAYQFDGGRGAWWSFDRKQAETKALHFSGVVIAGDVMNAHFDELLDGKVTAEELNKPVQP